MACVSSAASMACVSSASSLDSSLALHRAPAHGNAPLATSSSLRPQRQRHTLTCSAQLSSALTPSSAALRSSPYLKWVAGRRPGAVAVVRAGFKWVLEPVGDGDCSHLDAPVDRPAAIDLTEQDAVVVGRVGDRSDVVIPVPTVSGSHARVERKGDVVVVTDLNSTNGTYIDAARLRPGTPTAVPVGSVVTFGDEHLAQFRVTQVADAVEVVDVEASSS